MTIGEYVRTLSPAQAEVLYIMAINLRNKLDAKLNDSTPDPSESPSQPSLD